MADMVKRTVKLTKVLSKCTAYDPASLPVDLQKAAAAAQVSLKKYDLNGVRFQVMCVLDHSGSMSNDYRNGGVQKLMDRVLAYATQVDIDGDVQILPFDSKVHYRKKSLLGTVTLHSVDRHDYHGYVDASIYKPFEMGSTRMDLALEEVLRIAQRTPDPIVVYFVGDGNPDRGTEGRVEELIRELAAYPVFIKFLAIRPVPFLTRLDKLTGRPVDNVNAQDVPNPWDIPEGEFMDKLNEELPDWIAAATTAGILS